MLCLNELREPRLCLFEHIRTVHTDHEIIPVSAELKMERREKRTNPTPASD